MGPGNHAGNDTHPRAKQNSAGHDGDNAHVNQRTLYRHPGPGAEQCEQGKDGGNRQQLFRRVCGFMQKLAKQANANQEEQANQH